MGYGYSYGGDMGLEPFVDSGMDSAGAMASIGGFVLMLVLLFYLILFAFAIVSYVLQSVGMYTIAKRRGIRHPWLCWLPIGNAWILGSISDQYSYVAKGKIRNRRKVLLGLAIAAACIAVFVIWAFVAGTLDLLGFSAGTTQANILAGTMIAVGLVLYLAIIVLTIVQAVLQYIALYDLYASCNPDNSTLYLVLSIIFGVTLPFFVFACRNKDLGMPPRKEPEILPDPDTAGPEDFV